jgi:hypothetical protein
MVSFYDNPDSYDTSASLATLNDKIARAAQVGERLGRQDKSTALNRDFLSRVSCHLHNDERDRKRPVLNCFLIVDAAYGRGSANACHV